MNIETGYETVAATAIYHQNNGCSEKGDKKTVGDAKSLAVRDGEHAEGLVKQNWQEERLFKVKCRTTFSTHWPT